MIPSGRRFRSLPLVALIVVASLAGGCSSGGGGRSGLQAQPGNVTAPTQGWIPAGPVGPAALGVKWDWDRVAAYDSFLKGFGGGDTFYELVWCDVETAPDQRDWSRIDQVVNGAAQVGFEMNLKIRIGSCWATDSRLGARGGKNKTASLMPKDMATYEDFVRAVVARYAPRGVHRYAVENEVNGNGFWQSTPADYEQVVRAASTAIRATDPKAIVLDGGISATAYGAGVARWLLDQGKTAEAIAAWSAFYERRFDVRGAQLPRVKDAAGLRVALKGDQPARNLAFLDATFRLAAVGVLDAYQLHFYEPWGNVPLLLSYLRTRLPANLPVESWETGIFWPSGDEQAVPGETVKLTSLLLAGGVRRIIWLPAAHDPNGRRDAEYRFGLFDPDGSPRAGAVLFRDLAQAAAGSVVQGLPGDAVRGVALSRDATTVMAVWSDAGTRLTKPLPAGTHVVQSDGKAAPSGAAALDVDATARLLTVPGPADTALGLLK